MIPGRLCRFLRNPSSLQTSAFNLWRKCKLESQSPCHGLIRRYLVCAVGLRAAFLFLPFLALLLLAPFRDGCPVLLISSCPFRQPRGVVLLPGPLRDGFLVFCLFAFVLSFFFFLVFVALALFFFLPQVGLTSTSSSAALRCACSWPLCGMATSSSRFPSLSFSSSTCFIRDFLIRSFLAFLLAPLRDGFLVFHLSSSRRS